MYNVGEKDVVMKIVRIWYKCKAFLQKVAVGDFRSGSIMLSRFKFMPWKICSLGLCSTIK